MSEIIQVKDKIEFYKKLPQNGIIAEIGVWQCKNAKKLYEYCKPSEMVLVDIWKTIKKRGDEKNRSKQIWEQYYQKALGFAKSHDNITVIRGESVKTSKTFEDHYFDIIYIDAGHSYESCLADLNAWYPKIKPGGILCGHDYNENKSKRYGVVKAVDEFKKKNNLEIFMLSNVMQQRDWAIKVAL